MASPGMNSAFDELLGEGSNSENGPGNPEICYNDEFAAQEEEDRRMAEFCYMDSDCEYGDIPAQMFNIDNQGRAVHDEELSDGEEIFYEFRENNLTDEAGGARENGDGGEDRVRKVAKTSGGPLHGTSRAKRAVSAAMGAAGSDSGAEMSSRWSNAGETVWEGKNTDFIGEHPLDGEILLPRECGINPHPRERGGTKEPHTIKYLSLFFSDEMVDKVVEETNLYVKKLADLREPPQGFHTIRAANSSWPPESVKRFSKEHGGQEFNKAYFYRFLASLIYIGLHAPHKSVAALWSHEPSEYMEYLHKIISRNTFTHIKAVLHCQTDGVEEGKPDSAGLPLHIGRTSRGWVASGTLA
jgi:hypothetical protein